MTLTATARGGLVVISHQAWNGIDPPEREEMCSLTPLAAKWFAAQLEVAADQITDAEQRLKNERDAKRAAVVIMAAELDEIEKKLIAHQRRQS
jgi:hypothetical protein